MKPQPVTKPDPTATTAAAARPEAPAAQIIELPDLDEPPGSQAANLSSAGDILRQVKATLQVCVGNATLTVGELMAAKQQQVLVLDRGVQQPVDLLLEGKVVARGQLVAVGDQFAVRITQLSVGLDLAARSA